METGIADFVAQAAQLLFHREQGREDFFLAADEEFVFALTGTRSVDDLVAVLAGINDGIEIVGIPEPGLLLEVEVVDGRKKVDDGNAAEAQPGSVIKAKLGSSIKCNPGCFCWSQHDDGEFGQIFVPHLAKQITLGVAVVENGLCGERGCNGFHFSPPIR